MSSLLAELYSILGLNFDISRHNHGKLVLRYDSATKLESLS